MVVSIIFRVPIDTGILGKWDRFLQLENFAIFPKKSGKIKCNKIENVRIF